MDYRITLQVDGGIISSGVRVPASYGNHFVFSSEPEGVVKNAVEAVRNKIMKGDYLIDPRDSCIKARFVRLEDFGGESVPFEEGLIVRVTEAEILADYHRQLT